MVVHEDHARRVHTDGLGEELADPDQRRRDIPRIHPLLREYYVLRVENKNVELLAFQGSELKRNPISHISWASDGPTTANC